jgi:hypothetical protein
VADPNAEGMVAVHPLLSASSGGAYNSKQLMKAFMTVESAVVLVVSFSRLIFSIASHIILLIPSRSHHLIHHWRTRRYAKCEANGEIRSGPLFSNSAACKSPTAALTIPTPLAVAEQLWPGMGWEDQTRRSTST